MISKERKTVDILRPKKMMGMADLKEIELPIAADCDWVRGLDANGNPVRVLKSDFIENKKTFSLQAGEEVNTGINHAGIISITAGAITGSSSIGISTLNSTFISVLHEGAGSFAFVDSPGKLCCFKRDDDGTFFLKNNTPYSSPVGIAVL